MAGVKTGGILKGIKGWVIAGPDGLLERIGARMRAAGERASWIEPVIILLLAVFCLQGCSDGYSNGYNDGWDLKKNYFFLITNSGYREGLKDGTQDVAEYEKIQEVITEYPDNFAKAADALGLSTGELKEKLSSFDIAYRGATGED